MQLTGRTKEAEILRSALASEKPELAAIVGRRRVYYAHPLKYKLRYSTGPTPHLNTWCVAFLPKNNTFARFRLVSYFEANQLAG